MRAAAHPLALLLIGCAAGGDPGDGGSALPDRGFGGYARVLDADGDPYEPVPRPDGFTLRDPMARVVGDRVELYLARCPDDGGPCALTRALGDGLAFGPLELVATHPDGLTAPFAAADGLYAVRGPGDAIVRIEPGGDAVDVLIADAPLDAPSVVEQPDGRRLYVSVEVDGAPRLARAALGDAGAGPLEVLTLPPVPETWDPGAVLHPEVRRATTGAGRAVLRLAYAGRPRGRDADLAFAASFDGVTWSNWPFAPALGGDADERSPSNIRLGDRYLLYYGRGAGRVGVAERIATHATESF